MLESLLSGDPYTLLALLPLVVVAVLTIRLGRRADPRYWRRQTLQEIEAAGSFEAWKRLHFPEPGGARR